MAKGFPSSIIGPTRFWGRKHYAFALWGKWSQLCLVVVSAEFPGAPQLIGTRGHFRLWTRRIIITREPHEMRWRILAQRVLHPRYAHTTALKLRPYQETCLKSCLDALKEGSTKIGVSLPTGAGKTVVFVSLLERLQGLSRSPEATRSLVIVNSVELARQAAGQARKLVPHWTVEIEQGSRYTASGLADMYVMFAFLQPWH